LPRKYINLRDIGNTTGTPSPGAEHYSPIDMGVNFGDAQSRDNGSRQSREEDKDERDEDREEGICRLIIIATAVGRLSIDQRDWTQFLAHFRLLDYLEYTARVRSSSENQKKAWK
jgi:hypothetical protein